MDWGGKRHLRFTAAVDGDAALADTALSPGTQRGTDPGIKVKEKEISGNSQDRKTHSLNP